MHKVSKDLQVLRFMLTERFDAALSFTAKLHRTQLRKGTEIPYLGHLLAVAALVIEDGGSEDEAIAALLHDSLEDQGCYYPGGRNALRDSIHNQFGTAVADVVQACTDDEGFAKDSATTPAEERVCWLARKKRYGEEIAHKSEQALRVTAADKVHNVESILDAHAMDGPAVWSRFRTKSRQDQTDVYRELSIAIAKRNEELPVKTGLARRLTRAVGMMEKLA